MSLNQKINPFPSGILSRKHLENVFLFWCFDRLFCVFSEASDIKIQYMLKAHSCRLFCCTLQASHELHSTAHSHTDMVTQREQAIHYLWWQNKQDIHTLNKYCSRWMFAAATVIMQWQDLRKWIIIGLIISHPYHQGRNPRWSFMWTNYTHRCFSIWMILLAFAKANHTV